MKLRALLHDDDAVSPILGVVLMVGITLLISAVVASFVLGIGSANTTETPAAEFDFEYDGSSELRITAEAGNEIELQELYIRTTDEDAIVGPAYEQNASWDELFGTSGFSAVGLPANPGGEEYVDASQGIVVEVDSSELPGTTFRVVWSSMEHDQSDTLTTWEGKEP